MENNVNMYELVNRAKQGDAHSFALIYEQIYQDLYKTALYTLRNPEDAENVVSDTVLDAYAGIGGLRDVTLFRSWIFRILSNKCKRIIAGYIQERANVSEEPVENFEGVADGKKDFTEQVQNKSLIAHAFEILSDEERKIVTLTIYGELNSDEVAAEMGLNRNTVRSKYSRALAKMRNYIGNGGDMYGQQR